MLFKILSMPLAVSAALVSAGLISTSASAVWLDNNLRNGLQLGISGTLSPSFTKDSGKFTYLYGDPSVYDVADNPDTEDVDESYIGTMADVFADQDRRDTDERTRLSGLNSATVNFSANQMLTRDVSIYGTVGLWVTPSESARRGYSYGATITHSKIGSLGVNSNSAFATADIATSGTYNPLDTVGSAVSASYTAIPNLTLSAYHAFPESGDTRSTADAGLHSGYGLAASYTHSFAPRHNITIGAGHTKGKREVDFYGDGSTWTYGPADRYTDYWEKVFYTAPKEKEATAIGLSYQLDDWTLSVDGGKSTEEFTGEFYNRAKTDNYGVRVDYEFTPRMTAYASYGERKSKKDGVDGNQISYQDFLSAGVLGVNETLVFDEVKQKQYTVGASYDLYHNITFTGEVSGIKTKNYIAEGAFSKRDSLNYLAGVSFSF